MQHHCGRTFLKGDQTPLFKFVLECIYFSTKAMLVSRPAWRINITPHLFCQRYGQVNVSVSVLQLERRDAKRQLSMSTWHLICSCQSSLGALPRVMQLLVNLPCVFPSMFMGNKISGFGFTTLFSHIFYTSHHRTVQTATILLVQSTKSRLEIPGFENSEFCVLSQGLYCSLERAGLHYFSLFIFPKCRIFQPSAFKFGKVDNSLLSFTPCSIAQLWCEVVWKIDKYCQNTIEKYCRTFVVFPRGWCAFQPRKTLLLPRLGFPIVQLRPRQATKTKT